MSPLSRGVALSFVMALLAVARQWDRRRLVTQRLTTTGRRGTRPTEAAARAPRAPRLRPSGRIETGTGPRPSGRRRLSLEAAATATMPEAVDLLAVAADAGLPAVVAIGAVAGRAPSPWSDALGAVADRIDRGVLFADALAPLSSRCGGPGRRLAAVLRGAADGADLSSGLARLAADARDLRRRLAEEAARRIPVRLLGPLVLCALPAFVLLALVPLVAGAFEALHP